MPDLLHELDFLDHGLLHRFGERADVDNRPGDELALVRIKCLIDNFEAALADDLASASVDGWCGGSIIISGGWVAGGLGIGGGWASRQVGRQAGR